MLSESRLLRGVEEKLAGVIVVALNHQGKYAYHSNCVCLSECYFTASLIRRGGVLLGAYYREHVHWLLLLSISQPPHRANGELCPPSPLPPSLYISLLVHVIFDAGIHLKVGGDGQEW